jgi:hypothetical protein
VNWSAIQPPIEDPTKHVRLWNLRGVQQRVEVFRGPARGSRHTLLIRG